ncbi:CvpA family protein [Wolbachia pipientis]|uniref:CvpA family protein n=1 Tax=Wolbachia pipientis TaxID=955 RepID=A0A1E7QJH2_WOLPI|nr:CvpA family protein [Wolbachia pipientis]OEY86631.1 CvpA family protein [Wolbachia pipientis]
MLFDSIVIFIIVLCIIIAITRGFIKELCALMLLFLSFCLTVDYYDFFNINYSQYFSSRNKVNILSTISVFILLNLIFITLNNWIMYILLPIRLGLMDRLTGVVVGTLKGVLLSYMLFSVINLYCYIIYPEKEDSSDDEKKITTKEITRKEVLPDVIAHSYSYQILFSKMDDSVNSYIPDSLILKIKKIGQKFVKSEDKV